MENKNTIHGADNILATGAFLSFVAIIVSLFTLLINTTTELLSTTSTGNTLSLTGYSNFFLCGCTTSTLAQVALTAIAIGLPLLIACMWYMHRRYKDDVTLWNSPLQRVYMHIFLYASTLIALCVILSYVYELIGGKYSWVALFDVVSILVIAGYVFVYAWYRTHCTYNDTLRYARISQYFLAGLIAIVAAVVITHITVVGSPASQIKKANDLTRAYDLFDLQSGVINHYQETGLLPQNVDSFVEFYGVTADITTGIPYEYKIVSEDTLTFEVCAVFEAPFTSKKQVTSSSDVIASSYWDHPQGRHCFEDSIDTKKYPYYGDESVYME